MSFKFSSPAFRFHRRKPITACMRSERVINVDDLVYPPLCLPEIFERFIIDPFAFQNTVHPFGNGILIRITLFSHTDTDIIIH